MTFFFLTTWWFWITVILFIDLIVCEATDSHIIGAVSIVVAALMYQFVADVNLVGYVASHPLHVVGFILGYFVVGAVWSVVKWALHVLDCRDKYRELKAKYEELPADCRDVEGPRHNDQYKSLDHYIKNNLYYSKYQYSFPPPPKVSKHKKLVVKWIAYWPFSMIWSLIDDFVRRAAKAIYNFLSGFMQKISDKIFAGDLS